MELSDFLGKVGAMIEDSGMSYKFGSDWQEQQGWLQDMNRIKRQQEEAEVRER